MKTIYINEEDMETNVAVAEEGKIINFFTEKSVYAGAGNIYKGRITKLVSSMNFVFVDIGDEKPAFLSEKEYFDFTGRDYGQVIGIGDVPAEIDAREDITGIFEKGQELLVQVVKEPYKTKGARLTTNVMLPGHHIVYAPFLRHTGISRRIEDEKERERLRGAVDSTREKLKGEFGVIIRTQAWGVKPKDIAKEIEKFHGMWAKIRRGIKKRKAPSLVYEDEPLPVKTLREHMDAGVREVITDTGRIHDKVKAYFKSTRRKNIKLKQYEGAESIFEYYGLQNQVEGIFNSIVPFKKGGYIKIDVTEALTVIDINSGKFKGTDDVESSLLMLNLNAVKEIARQIILRNIGGLIVVDFIDMQAEENRQMVKAAMDEELSKSKLFFKTLKISEFGLMEITRKRDAKKVEEEYFEECGCCGGRGIVLTGESVCINWLKKIKYK